MIRLRDDTKAIIKWDFKRKDVFYSHYVFTLKGNNIELIATGRGLPKITYTIENYREKTARQVIDSYNADETGFFEDSILTIWHDLGLPLGYVKTILKEI